MSVRVIKLAAHQHRMETTFDCKGKASLYRPISGPDGSRNLRLPDSRQSTHECGKFVSPTERPPLPSPAPGNIPGTHLF